MMSRWALTLAALALLAGAAALCFRGDESRAGAKVGLVMLPDAEATPWSERPWLPETVGPWVGEAMVITSNEVAVLPADTQFARRRYRAEGVPFEIMSSIVLSGTSRGSIHRAEFCMRGQGWNATAGPFPVRLSTGRIMEATLLDMNRVMDDGRQKVPVRGLYAYWFVGAEEVTSQHLHRLVSTAWQRLRYGVNQRWAYVIAVITYPEDRNPDTARQAREALQQFVSEAAPRFQRAGI